MIQQLQRLQQLRHLVRVPRHAGLRPGRDGGGRKAADAAEHAAAPALPREADCGRDFRRRFPIAAYVGSNGSGKTLCMVHDTLPSVYGGRTVYSTVPITFADGSPAPNVVLLHDWSQILDAEHADILLDEVSAIASSRESESLPPQVATMLQQLRKRDLVLRWTAPSWARADKILRETTKIVTICHGFLSRSAQGSMWRSNRLFRFETFSAEDYTDFQAVSTVKTRLSAETRDWFRLSRHIAPRCYDTLASVSTIGTVLVSGRCAVCGGRRRVPECTCEDYRHRR